MKTFIATFAGSCAGLGFFPFAPGTVTSLAAAVFFAAVPAFQQLKIAVSAVGVVFVVGLWSAGIMERIYGHDPSQVTIDEVAGQWIALLLLPAGWFSVVLGFFLCWIPVIIIGLLAHSSVVKLPDFAYELYTLLAFTSTVINPFIYGVANRDFRREFLTIFHCS